MVRRPILVELAVVLAIGLSALGCADDGDAGTAVDDPSPTSSDETDDGDPAEVLRGAIEETRAVDTLSVSLRLALDGGTFLGSQSTTLSGVAALDGSTLDISAGIGDEAEAVRIVVLDGTAWVGGQSVDVRAALPEGAEWVELPAADLQASPAYSDPGELAFLYLLNGAMDVEEEGDGRYTFDVDLDEAVAASPPERRVAVAATLTFNGDSTPEVSGSVELDDEGRVRRLEVSGIQRPTPDERESFDLEEDFELSVELEVGLDDIDDALDVDAPDADVVADIDEAPEMATLLELDADG